MAAISVSIRSSSKLACCGFNCSLRLANLKRLSCAISWASVSLTVFLVVDLLAHCLDFLIETLDTLHQLRRQSAQLFRV